MASWNIKRGLATKITEFSEFAWKNDLDILYLIETDTRLLNSENDLQVKGYKTILQVRENADDIVRIVALVKISERLITIKQEPSSKNYPSI